jgi:hypothetical protein
LDTNKKPLPREDEKLDEATSYSRGTWIGGDQAVVDILAQDHTQVYGTSIVENLETRIDSGRKHRQWMAATQQDG